MITQKILARTDSLKLDKIISRYGEDSMRQVVFIIVRPDPESEELIPITIPEDAVGSFRILKPSGNFVIVPMSKSVLATGETAFDVVLPASANTAKGSGYYDIRITSDTDKYYFTAQGDFLIDDNIITDEALEDVSEVNGLIFPDDFYTKDDMVTIIDDDTVSTDTTWSSEKISNEIDIIDDDTVSTDTTWSSEKISNEIDIIDDDTVSTDTTWSSDKIQDEIEINSGKHYYSTSEQVVGKWIDGSTLYEKSYHVPTVTSTYIIIDSTISASTIKLRNVSMGSIVIGGAYNNAQYVGGHLSYMTFIRVILNVGGLSVGMEDPPAEPITDFDFTIRYTKSNP